MQAHRVGLTGVSCSILMEGMNPGIMALGSNTVGVLVHWYEKHSHNGASETQVWTT